MARVIGIRLYQILLCAAILTVGLGQTWVARADVWDDWDYPGQKRTLKVWVRGAGNIPGFAAAVQAAMDNWNGTSGNPPRDNNGAWNLVAGDAGDHDVDVGGGAQDGAGGTLGETTANDGNGDGVAEGGTSITIDNKENWGAGADQQDLERTIKHELGHAQRMDDTAIAGDLMNGGQAAGNHNVTPSGHDQDEARAAFWDNMLIDILPERLRTGESALCSITGTGINLTNVANVSLTPLDPTHLQISNVNWNPTQIQAMFLGMPPSVTSSGAWHNEGFCINILYNDNSTATLGSFITINPVDPPVDMLPHANAGTDVTTWIGHTFTLHGCDSYHDEASYTGSLVHVWKWATQPGLPGGLAQTEMNSLSIDQPGTYTFSLEVEDVFCNRSTDTVSVTVEPYPPAGTDCFESTVSITLIDPQGGSHPVTLHGPVSVSRTAAVDPGDGRREIQTELISMNLTGYDPVLGRITLTNKLGSPSTGQMKQSAAGVYYPIDSFFDVFYEIEIGNDPPLYNASADHLVAPGGVNGIPFPDGTIHRGTAVTAIPLNNQDGSTSQWMYISLEVTKQKSSISDPDAACGDSIVSLDVRNTSTNEVETVVLKGTHTMLWTSTGQFDASQFVDFATFGISPLLGGSIRIVPSGELSSNGRITPQTPGVDFPADSFFDVFVEVQTPSGALHNCAPIRMSGVISDLPMPVGTAHITTPGASIPLLDSNGNPTNYVIESFRHTIGLPQTSYSVSECYGVSGVVTYQHPTTGLSNTPFSGTIVTRRNPPGPDPGPIPIEIVGMSLQSVEPLTVVYSGHESLDRVSNGSLVPQDPGSQWMVDSFFDIFTELSLTDGKTITNCGPLYLRSDAPISGLPFAPGTSFSKAWLSPPVAMYSDGQPYGQIEGMSLVIGEPCRSVASPTEAKQQEPWTPVTLSGPVVSSFFDVFFYVQTPLPLENNLGISGIRINDSGLRPPLMSLGDMVSVSGILRVEDGEAFIEVATVTPGPPHGPPSPWAMPLPRLGGAQFGIQPAVGSGVGLNTTGLLASVHGWVQSVDTDLKTAILTPQPGAYLPGDVLTLDFNHTTPQIALPESGHFIVATGAIAGKGVPGGGDIEPRLHVVSFEDMTP